MASNSPVDVAVSVTQRYPEIDQLDGEFMSDFEKAQRYRNDTVQFVRQCLSVHPYQKIDTSLRPILETSRDVWETLRRGMGLDERADFAEEIRVYREMVDLEQKLRLSAPMPSLEGNWLLQKGTSAAAGASSSNVLFILYAATGSIYSAVQASLGLLQECSDDYELCVARLLEAYGGEPGVEDALKKLVIGCRYFCTGNLTWTLSTKRYVLETKGDGKVVVHM
ncbi:hypothetical protein LTS10_010711 [Elasticomyces elasticus]|nr:hypothetical protein LTS10_010711 [Elasticomyces elasticus]